MVKVTSRQRKLGAALVIALILALPFLPGCVEFGPKELRMLQGLSEKVDKGIENFDIRGKQAIDVFGQLPADFGNEGAKLGRVKK